MWITSSRQACLLMWSEGWVCVVPTLSPTAVSRSVYEAFSNSARRDKTRGTDKRKDPEDCAEGRCMERPMGVRAAAARSWMGRIISEAVMISSGHHQVEVVSRESRKAPFGECKERGEQVTWTGPLKTPETSDHVALSHGDVALVTVTRPVRLRRRVGFTLRG